MSTPPPIQQRLFVVGVPRAGTTLLQALLAAHSEVTSFTESHLLSRHVQRLPFGLSRVRGAPRERVRTFLEENGLPPAEAAPLLERAAPGSASGGVLGLAQRGLELFDHLAQRQGCARWVEKTPMHLRHLALWERAGAGGPPLAFVHVLRDGLDTVASLREASQHWERAYDLVACVRRWNEDMARSAQRLDSPRDHFVTYEDLCAEPEAVLRRLLTALELPFEPELFARYAADSARLVTPGETWKTDAGATIRPGAGAAERLTPEERERVTSALRMDLFDSLRAAARGERTR